MMSSVVTQRIPELVTKEVKELLNPFFTRDYSDDVGNPVLLLNFLYRHSVISKPVYNVRDDPNKPFHFIGSCSLAPLSSEDGVVSCAVPALEVEARASSEGECRNIAAQKILNLLLENEMMNLINHDDNREKQIDLETQQMDIDREEEEEDDDHFDESAIPPCAFEPTENMHVAENFYEDDLTGMLRFEDFIVDLKSELPKKKGKKRRKRASKAATGMMVDPQHGDLTSGSMSSSAMGGEEGSSVSARRSSNSSTGSIDKATLKELSSATTIGRWLSEDTPETNTKRSSSSRSRRKRPRRKKKDSSSLLSSSSSSSSLLSSSSSSSSLSSSSSSASGESSVSSRSCKVSFFDDNMFEDFFDPFSKLRPKIIHYLNAHQSDDATSQSGSANNETADAQVKFPAEFCPSNKTPFQILQEKAVKNYKLIPRSRIETIDAGFSCTLILDSRTGHGVGRTKKEAKVKAAIHVLQQLENPINQPIPTEN